MTKKYLCFLLCVLGIVLISSCGQSNNSTTTTTTSTTTTTNSSGRRTFPNTSNGIYLFSDQFSSTMTDAQFQFAADHYVGCQKMTRSQTRQLRSYNSNFIVLHYRLGIGLGYQRGGTMLRIVVGDDWVQEWPATQEASWFFPYGGSDRVLKADEGWYLMDISSTTWRNYWVPEVLSQIATNESDGLFADVFIVPNYLGPTLFDPDLPDVDVSFEAQWSTNLHEFADYLEAQFAGRYYLIPNIGSMINGRDATDYTNLDGAMIENFAAWSSGDYYEIGDWELHLNRVVPLVSLDKILICQSYLSDPAETAARLFFLANYLLIKGNHTYFTNYVDEELNYFPEYDISLGAATESAVSSIAELYNATWGVYCRHYANGMVLVNPTDSPVTISNLGATYYQATPVGGGAVPADGIITSWRVDYSAVTSVTLAAHAGAILRNSAP